MGLNYELLNQLLKEVTTFNDISLSDIPEIDLYMDQVTTLFEKKLYPLKRDEEDKIMTKTMINNYAKAKIFPPVKSKKYNKEQIILLELIYNLKQNLTLTDINRVFTPIIEDGKKEEKTLASIESLYGNFLRLKRDQSEAFETQFNQLRNEITNKSKDLEGKNKELNELILMVFMLISGANAQKRMAEKIIDNFFTKGEVKE
ncbi:MAG: DUF1836 domain-containing protein [Clostridiaceae bacterium]|nr:DUF1836 domain-containing protein [Clostridiaceae bacterium]